VVFDALRGWLRGRTTGPAAAGVPAVAVAPRDDDPGWRGLPVQRLTLGPPELVSDPQGFGDSLASWRSPSLQTPLGHAVSAQAPSGVVDGVVQPRPGPVSVQRWESAVGEVPPGGPPVARVATTGTAEEVAPDARPVESVRPVDAVAPVIVPEAAAPVTPAVPGVRVPPVVVPLAPQRTLTVARAVELPLRTLPVRSLPPVKPVPEPREAVPVQRVEADSQPAREPERVVVSVDEERPLVGERPVVEAAAGDSTASTASVAPVAMGAEAEGRSLLGERPDLPVAAPAVPEVPQVQQIPQAPKAPQVPKGAPVVSEGPPAAVQVQRGSGDPVGGEQPAMPSPSVVPPVSAAEQPKPRAVQEPVADAAAGERPLVGEQPLTSLSASPPAAPEVPEPTVPAAPVSLPLERHVHPEVPAVQRSEVPAATVAEPPAQRPLVGEEPLIPASAPPPVTPEHAPARRVGLGAPLPSVPGPVSVQRQEQPPAEPAMAPAPRRPGLGAPLPAVPVPPSVPASAPEPVVPLPVVPEVLPAVAREPLPGQRQQPLTVVRATPLQRAAQEAPLVPETLPQPVAGLVGERGLELRSAPLPTPDPGPGSVPEAGTPHAPGPAGRTATAPPVVVPVIRAPLPAAPAAVQRSVRPEPVVPGPVESAAVPSWATPPVAVPVPVQRSVPPGSAPPVPWEVTHAPVQRVLPPEPPPGPAVPVAWAPATAPTPTPAPVQRAAEPEPPSPPESPPPPPAPPAPPGQQAPAPAAPGESTDELVRRLIGPLSRLLRAELRLDRERAGVRLDPRH
jgi:hypothetical protein